MSECMRRVAWLASASAGDERRQRRPSFPSSARHATDHPSVPPFMFPFFFSLFPFCTHFLLLSRLPFVCCHSSFGSFRGEGVVYGVCSSVFFPLPFNFRVHSSRSLSQFACPFCSPFSSRFPFSSILCPSSLLSCSPFLLRHYFLLLCDPGSQDASCFCPERRRGEGRGSLAPYVMPCPMQEQSFSPAEQLISPEIGCERDHQTEKERR